jgi:UDP-2,4-diacetamido-2,4,6-trideoxy-beta-L-altropyranose hydrolase
MRCLTLADELARQGAIVQFICREHKGHLRQLIEERGYTVSLLPLADKLIAPSMPVHTHWIGEHWQQDAEQTSAAIKETIDWLIVDHYGLDARWHKQLRQRAEKIMVIDDLADRELDCDLLLDQNFYTNQSSRYAQYISKDCTCLLGPQYALLRNEFIELRKQVIARKNLDKLLIFFSASDPVNETYKAASALTLFNNIKTDIVVGKNYQHIEAITKLCKDSKHIKLHVDINYMARLMASSDLAIGAMGGATWERIFLGLPTAMTTLANHQIQATKDICTTGTAWHLGNHTDTTSNTYATFLDNLIGSSALLNSASEACFKLTGHQRVYGAQAIAEHLEAN